MHSIRSFDELNVGDAFKLPVNRRIKIRTAALNHPEGATGYRIEYGGKAMCYAKAPIW